MQRTIRIGTRESQLAVWQASQVKEQLAAQDLPAELVLIRSEGDNDLHTPLYEMGVQGIFTRSLDQALLNHAIDIAVHSMKDVPVELPMGVAQAAVLKRGPVQDLLVFKTDGHFLREENRVARIATGSLRRKAQWLHKYPRHEVYNLRGNINTRLKKLETGEWDAAIFALAGLERIGIKPPNSMALDWMLPAPAQGAILVVCREEDEYCLESCRLLNDPASDLCTKIEREFLKTLLGGCSTPISALAEIEEEELFFRGNILSPDGRKKAEVEKVLPVELATFTGKTAAEELLERGGRQIAEEIDYAAKHG